MTHFAGDREPSVEDDLIYLRNEDGRWLIVKPSATLYRAIGVGDIPPQVLAAAMSGTGANADGDDLRPAAAEQGDEAALRRRARSSRADDAPPRE